MEPSNGVKIRPLTDQAALAGLIAAQPLQPFLQSWAWGEFQQAYGRRIWRLGGWEGNQLVVAALLIEHQLLLGKTYVYCPRGPLANSLQHLQAMYTAIRELGDQVGSMFVKIDPPTYGFSFEPRDYPSGFSPGTTLQPQHTLVLDLTQPAEALLSGMHQKTRYNIRLAEKRGVAVRWSTHDEDVATWLELMHQTYSRQGIRLHPDVYYQKMFSILKSAEMSEIGLAEYEGQAIAANLVLWHGRTATYLHGGSADIHKELMAPHLLQWRTIERAQTKKCTAYDLWGVAPDDVPEHAWSGVTRFKKGFDGKLVEFPPAANVILQSNWYWAYRFAKRVRGGVDI